MVTLYRRHIGVGGTADPVARPTLKMIASPRRLALLVVASFSLLSTGLSGFAQRQVSVRGPDTMLPLLERWRQAYRTATGRTATVSEGGSGAGILALTAGSATIAASSRPIPPPERDSARSRGILLTETPVALDGIAIVVRSDNPIASVDLQTLADIYTGRLDNWGQIGGKNRPIAPIVQRSDSDCQDLFLDRVLNFRRPVPNLTVAATPKAVVGLVRSLEGAVGYGSVALFSREPDIRVVPISAKPGDEPLLPTEANIRERRYPLWRILYLVTNGRPTGEVQRFVEFARSPEGQRIVEQSGFFRLDAP